MLYPGSTSGSPQHLSPQHNAFISQFHQHQQAQQSFYLNNVPQDIFPSNMPPAITSTLSSPNPGGGTLGRGFQQRHVVEARRSDVDKPTPMSQDRHNLHHNYNHTHTHAHSHSVTTVTAPSPPPGHSPVINPATMRLSVQVRSSSPLRGLLRYTAAIYAYLQDSPHHHQYLLHREYIHTHHLKRRYQSRRRQPDLLPVPMGK